MKFEKTQKEIELEYGKNLRVELGGGKIKSKCPCGRKIVIAINCLINEQTDEMALFCTCTDCQRIHVIKDNYYNLIEYDPRVTNFHRIPYQKKIEIFHIND